MIKSEKPSFVLRNTSFTMRERLMPAIACSTLTRIRERLRFFRFSDAVNSPLRGFFSADKFYEHAVHNPESLYLCRAWLHADKRFVRSPQLSCREFYLRRFDSNSRRASF